jgi:DNA polymerase V
MIRKTNPDRNTELEPLENPSQVTGFASPAGDYAEVRLHIIQRLVKDPTNTYYFEMENNDMIRCGICRGALLVVDRSLTPKLGSTVIVNYDGHWITRLIEQNNIKYLTTGEITKKLIQINDEGINVFGVVA